MAVRGELSRGADVNYSQRKTTPLMNACQQDSLPLVSLLLEQPGILVNARNLQGRTALHLALQWVASPAVVRLILSCPGVNVEARDKMGVTPLMLATQVGGWGACKHYKNSRNPKILLIFDPISMWSFRQNISKLLLPKEFGGLLGCIQISKIINP